MVAINWIKHLHLESNGWCKKKKWFLKHFAIVWNQKCEHEIENWMDENTSRKNKVVHKLYVQIYKIYIKDV